MMSCLLMYPGLLNRDVFQFLDVDVVLSEQRAHPLFVARLASLLHLLNVPEAVGLLDESSADDHDYDRYDAHKEHGSPPVTDEKPVYPRREKHAQRPPALHDRV